MTATITYTGGLTLPRVFVTVDQVFLVHGRSAAPLDGHY